jgi:lysophospholipase
MVLRMPVKEKRLLPRKRWEALIFPIWRVISSGMPFRIPMLIILICLSRLVWGVEALRLGTVFNSEILPYFNTSQSFTMINNGVQIRYRYYPANAEPAKGTVVIVTGRTEFMAKYAELLYDLRTSGYEFFIYDHRGQGESDRLIGDPAKGFVDHYQDYISDLTLFMNQIVLPHSGGPIYMLAHSMGGAIASAYAIDHPDDLKALVLSSPMLSIQFLLGETLSADVAAKAVAIGFGESVAFGYSGEGYSVPFEKNIFTHSRARFAYVHDLELYHPDWVIGGPTNQWVREAVAMDIFVRENAKKLVAPTLIFEATGDSIVNPTVDEQFVAAAKRAQIIKFEGAKHEILVEEDHFRDKALRSLLDFFKMYP